MKMEPTQYVLPVYYIMQCNFLHVRCWKLPHSALKISGTPGERIIKICLNLLSRNFCCCESDDSLCSFSVHVLSPSQYLLRCVFTGPFR